MENFSFLPRYLFVLWWVVTLIALTYYEIVDWRLWRAAVKTPLGPDWHPLIEGKREQYLTFAFAAGFIGMASLWFGAVDLVGANLGVGWLVPALLVGGANRWAMSMRLRRYKFDE